MRTSFRSTCYLFLLFLLLLFCAQVFAQEYTVGKKLDEVVIRAERTQRQNHKLPVRVDVLQQLSIQQRGARTTPEALTAVNCAFIQKTNYGGVSPFLRGFTENYILILVDSVRLNNAIFRFGPNKYGGRCALAVHV